MGDGGFFAARVDSPSIERGLYFGRPEETRELRLRTEADDRALIDALGLPLSDGDEDLSSSAASFLRADCLRVWRVIVLTSGDVASSFFFAAGFSTELRAGARWMALVRRAAVSFAFSFFDALSLFSFDSLCITSARALPTEERPKDWRIELRVIGLLRGGSAPLPEAASVGMAVVYMGYTRDKCASKSASGPSRVWCSWVRRWWWGYERSSQS